MRNTLTTKILAATAVGVLSLGAAACSDDDEDEIENDVEDVGNDVEDGVEDGVDEVEQGVDEVEQEVEGED